MRDEGLLKLFFAGAIDPKRAAEVARERAAISRPKAAELRAIAEQVERTGAPEGIDAEPDAGSLTVLRYGIEMSEWTAEWFERAADDLEKQNADADVGAAGEVGDVQLTRIARTAARQAHGDPRGDLLRRRRCARRRSRRASSAPYGADDPSTESVKAADRLEDDGYRDAGVIVLIAEHQPHLAGRAAEDSQVETQLRANPDVARVTGYLETRTATSSRATVTRPTWRPA